MAAIATPSTSATESRLKRVEFKEENTIFLEKWIDGLEINLPPLSQFILPVSIFPFSPLFLLFMIIILHTVCPLFITLIEWLIGHHAEWWRCSYSFASC
jgi:hypothetical protein